MVNILLTFSSEKKTNKEITIDENDFSHMKFGDLKNKIKDENGIYIYVILVYFIKLICFLY